MKKSILSLLALACMLMLLLAACGGDDTITTEKAQQIVLEELGLSKDEAHPHVHVGEYEGKPCYSEYVTVDGVNWEYLVNSATGEILSVRQGGHSH